MIFLYKLLIINILYIIILYNVNMLIKYKRS